MSELYGLHPEVRAPDRLGVTEQAYRELVGEIADRLADGDGDVSVYQRTNDLDTAEWIVGFVYAAGYRLEKVAA